MYDSSGAWGGRNPFGGTLVVLTHRTEDQPDDDTGFVMVDGFDAAFARAREAAAGGGVAIGGGADVIRQALAAGVVDELGISTAPVVLGAGKRLFEGFDRDVDLDIMAVHHSPYAVHVRYAVRR
jgi:dihydrofolate reductase